MKRQIASAGMSRSSLRRHDAVRLGHPRLNVFVDSVGSLCEVKHSGLRWAGSRRSRTPNSADAVCPSSCVEPPWCAFCEKAVVPRRNRDSPRMDFERVVAPVGVDGGRVEACLGRSRTRSCVAQAAGCHACVRRHVRSTRRRSFRVESAIALCVNIEHFSALGAVDQDHSNAIQLFGGRACTFSSLAPKDLA